jgi:hypothetical protein
VEETDVAWARVAPNYSPDPVTLFQKAVQLEAIEACVHRRRPRGGQQPHVQRVLVIEVDIPASPRDDLGNSRADNGHHMATQPQGTSVEVWPAAQRRPPLDESGKRRALTDGEVELVPNGADPAVVQTCERRRDVAEHEYVGVEVEEVRPVDETRSQLESQVRRCRDVRRALNDVNTVRGLSPLHIE